MVFCSSDNCLLHCDGTVNASNFSISNIFTYNFQYHSFNCHKLPGENKINSDCRSQCKKAHDNLLSVVHFIQNVLQHDWENQSYVSSINCVADEEESDNVIWRGAGWHRDFQQAVFGQCLIDNQLCSLGSALDIVAHEFFHGITMQTARLDYSAESGALNESYSDIFAILVVNFDQSDISQWQWEIGMGFGNNGGAIRSLENPGDYGQTESFNDYDKNLWGYLKPCKYNDNGNVHKNSGIHNKAAFNLLTSMDENQQYYLFDAASGVKLFYSALNRLRKTATFIDSYREIKKAAKHIFRNYPDKEEKLAAIDIAFSRVGIELTDVTQSNEKSVD